MSHRTPVRTGSLALVLFLVLTALTASAALAQGGDTKQVGLVVTFADGKTSTQVVTVPKGASALDALQASKLAVVTAQSAQGPSLCKINDTGCPTDNCFCDQEHFWAYYHLNGNAWAAATEGAGVYVPANGAVEGFAWSGFDANFNPTTQPPVSTFDQLAATQQPASGLQPGVVIAAVLVVLAFAAAGAFLLARRRRA